MFVLVPLGVAEVRKQSLFVHVERTSLVAFSENLSDAEHDELALVLPRVLFDDDGRSIQLGHLGSTEASCKEQK